MNARKNVVRLKRPVSLRKEMRRESGSDGGWFECLNLSLARRLYKVSTIASTPAFGALWPLSTR